MDAPEMIRCSLRCLTVLRKYRYFASLFVVLSTAFIGASAAQRGQNWDIKIGLEATYDNNILRYSEKYLERFINRQDEGRYHITTRDDLLLHTWLRVSRSLQAFGDLTSVLSTNIHYRTYTQNSVKNWAYLSMGWRQDLSRQLSFYASYSFIPEYYVRHYRDEDWMRRVGTAPASFQAFTFSKDNLGIWIQYRLPQNTRFRFSYAYIRYFHNSHYTEYDSRNHQYGFQTFHRLHRNIAISAGYKFMTSGAKGYDQPGEAVQNSDDADASYKENQLFLSVELSLPEKFGNKSTVTLEGEYAHRRFATAQTVETDPLHAGRIDDELDLAIAYSLEVSDGLRLGVNYCWRWRDARTRQSQNATYVSDEKDYRQHTIGLEMTYALRF